MLFSAGNSQLAILAYVPAQYESLINGKDWLEYVTKPLYGKFLKQQGDLYMGKVDTYSDKGVCPGKLQERGIADASFYLEAKGLYLDADYDLILQAGRHRMRVSSRSAAADEQSEDDELLSPSSASSCVDSDENEDEGQLLSAGGGVCQVCRNGTALRCTGPCKLVDCEYLQWVGPVANYDPVHYDHCHACWTAAETLDATGQQVLMYRLAARYYPEERRHHGGHDGEDRIWDPIAKANLHVPMDLEIPAGPAVAAARAGSLASIWVWQPPVEDDEEEIEACRLADEAGAAAIDEESSSHSGSEASRPQSPSSVPTPVQSVAIDVDDFADPLHNWYLDSSDAVEEGRQPTAGEIRLPVCTPQSFGECTRQTSGSPSTNECTCLVEEIEPDHGSTPY